MTQLEGFNEEGTVDISPLRRGENASSGDGGEIYSCGGSVGIGWSHTGLLEEVDVRVSVVLPCHRRVRFWCLDVGFCLVLVRNAKKGQYLEVRRGAPRLTCDAKYEMVLYVKKAATFMLVLPERPPPGRSPLHLRYVATLTNTSRSIVDKLV